MYLDDNAIVTAEKLRHNLGLKGKSLQSAVMSTVIMEWSMSVVRAVRRGAFFLSDPDIRTAT